MSGLIQPVGALLLMPPPGAGCVGCARVSVPSPVSAVVNAPAPAPAPASAPREGDGDDGTVLATAVRMCVTALVVAAIALVVVVAAASAGFVTTGLRGVVEYAATGLAAGTVGGGLG